MEVMSMRCTMVWMAAVVAGLVAEAARGSFIHVDIVGEDGTNRVTIGPEGGRVPFSIFLETLREDPLPSGEGGEAQPSG